MNIHEIVLWVDSRWCKELESATGKAMDVLMQEQVDALIQKLPQDVRDRINEQIRQEDEQRAAEMERNRRFSVSRVTECGETHIYLNERGESPFHTAQRLRRYLRGEDQAMYPDGAALTEPEMEQYVAEAVNGSPRVVGVYDIDLDSGEFSMLDAKEGWQTFRTKDISTAVYYATKKESADWVTKRDSFQERLDQLELLSPQRPVFIRGAEPLPVDKVRFEKQIGRVDHRLNFCVRAYFDLDSVLGTHVGSSENDDWLNLLASYDMKRGCVDDAIAICLVRGDGSALECHYRLSPEECAALLPKMDAYYKKQIGVSLEEARAQYLSEQAPPQIGPAM